MSCQRGRRGRPPLRHPPPPPLSTLLLSLLAILSAVALALATYDNDPVSLDETASRMELEDAEERDEIAAYIAELQRFSAGQEEREGEGKEEKEEDEEEGDFVADDMWEEEREQQHDEQSALQADVGPTRAANRGEDADGARRLRDEEVDDAHRLRGERIDDEWQVFPERTAYFLSTLVTLAKWNFAKSFPHETDNKKPIKFGARADEGAMTTKTYRERYTKGKKMYDSADVCHVIAHSNGGADAVQNYFMCPSTFNQAGRDTIDALNAAYIGLRRTREAYIVSKALTKYKGPGPQVLFDRGVKEFASYGYVVKGLGRIVKKEDDGDKNKGAADAGKKKRKHSDSSSPSGKSAKKHKPNTKPWQ